MDIVMPPSFPTTEFGAFGQAATEFFPSLLSDEALFDPQEKKRNFEWARQAVRYRYRSCAECQDEFRSLLANASEMWLAGWPDEEFTYRLEHCIYLFFVSAVSIFDSFTFCLYFLGHAIQPGDFPAVANPRKITQQATEKAYRTAFSKEKITGLLTALLADPTFDAIGNVRNLVGHRLAGRRSVASSGTLHPDSTHTEDWRKETWALPGATGTLDFADDMLQRRLDDITRLLTALASAAHEFAQNHRPVQSTP